MGYDIVVFSVSGKLTCDYFFVGNRRKLSCLRECAVKVFFFSGSGVGVEMPTGNSGKT